MPHPSSAGAHLFTAADLGTDVTRFLRASRGWQLLSGERLPYEHPARPTFARVTSFDAIGPLPGRLFKPVIVDPAMRWKGPAPAESTIIIEKRSPWNKGRLIGQKRPLKPKGVWTIRVSAAAGRTPT